MEYLVDTNVLVYETIVDSAYHREVVSNLERLSKVYISTISLVELSLVLWRLQVDNELIIERIKEIVSDNRYILIDVSTADVIDALKMIEEEGMSISYLSDKIILSTAKRLKLGIYTYDKKLRGECQRNNVPTL